jgi:hypothetical protein
VKAFWRATGRGKNLDVRQRPAPQRPGRHAAVHPDRRIRRGTGGRRAR